MTVPCLMDLKCPHCILDEDYDPVCCHPYTIQEIDEVRWMEANGLCGDMGDCPLLDRDSDLGFLLRLESEYMPEEGDALLRCFHKAVGRGDIAKSERDAMREEADDLVFARYIELYREGLRLRRDAE